MQKNKHPLLATSVKVLENCLYWTFENSSKMIMNYWNWKKKLIKKNVRCFSSLSLEDHFSHGILMKRIKNRRIMKIKKKLVIDYLLSWLQWHGWLWELNVVNKVWRNNERYPKLFAKVTWKQKQKVQKCPDSFSTRLLGAIL